MKCLLCKFKSNEKPELENHYLNFHNVDKSNVYLMKRTMFFTVEDVSDVKNLFQRAGLSCFMIF